MSLDVYILGAGGNSKIVIDICKLLGHNIVGLFDDLYRGYPIAIYRDCSIIGTIRDFKSRVGPINVINSIGDNKIRAQMFKDLDRPELNWINCIHPQAYLSPSCRLGRGNIIAYGAVINSSAIIKDFNLINTLAIIEHDNHIGSFNHIAPHTSLCGSVILGDGNLLGTGVRIIPGVILGDHNIVGAGSVVLYNFHNYELIVGHPAKIKRVLK